MKQKQAAFSWWPVFVSYPFLSVTDRIDKQKAPRIKPQGCICDVV